MGFSCSVIIFHPGSRHLYFGRSSDSKPQSILHAIARRHLLLPGGSRPDKPTNSTAASSPHRDPLFPLSDKRLAEPVPLDEIESCRLQLIRTLQSSFSSLTASNSYKLGGEGSQEPLPNPLLFTDDIANLNAFNKCSSQASNLNLTSVSKSGVSLSVLSGSDNRSFLENPVVVGEDVLKIQREDPFHVHFPWRRGQLHLHREIGGSISSVVQDLEDIWRWCVIQKLGIPQSEIKNYRAIVIIPVMFDRIHAKELMNLILSRLGFQSCFFLQDHICASFGAGVSTCTVVDVGDQKISVSCVEDGVSYPNSRLELKYGSGDLTFALWSQLRLTSFPILGESIADPAYWEFLNHLKESRCHFDLSLLGGVGSVVFQDLVSWPQLRPSVSRDNTCSSIIIHQHTVKFGIELLLIPFSYFRPDILLRGSIGAKAVISYSPQPSIPDDPHDQNFLADVTIKRSKKEVSQDSSRSATVADEDTTSTADDSGIFPSCKPDAFNVPLGIDQAVIRSINMCNISDELKRRLFSYVVVIGGGFKINGLSTWLSASLKHLTPKYFPVETLEEAHNRLMAESLSSSSSSSSPIGSSCPPIPHIITCAADAKSTSVPGDVKDEDNNPCITTWKGAAIISSLDTAKTLWITREEWVTQGSKILREKSLFHY